MGIQNLLPFVKQACRQGSIAEFRGCSVAVDTSCLLHRGLFGCMEDLAVGKDSKAYIYYVKKYIDALLALDCHVILADPAAYGGGTACKDTSNLGFRRPSIAGKEGDECGEARSTGGEHATGRDTAQPGERGGAIAQYCAIDDVTGVTDTHNAIIKGKTEAANSLFRQSTAITPEIVEMTIKYFRALPNVDIIVAPYESDAQLAFLTRERLADVVITEDSDLIAFGCERVAFKFDPTGPCTIYEREKLPTCFSGKMASEFSFTTFRRICIMAGCDYLQEGLKGVGLAKALTFFSKCSGDDLKKILPRVPSYLRMPKLKIPPEFIEDFTRAERTFLYQVVYDPRSRAQCPLNPYPLEEKGKENIEGIVNIDDDDDFMPTNGGGAKSSGSSSSSQEADFSFAGTVASSSQSTRLALGNAAKTASQIEDVFRLPPSVPTWSIWSDHYESRSQRLLRSEEERKEKGRKTWDLGAFKLDSPERRRKKVIAVDEIPEVLMLDDDDDADFTVAGKKKKIVPSRASTMPTKTAAKRLRNEAEMPLSADALMEIYGASQFVVDTATSGTTVGMETTVVTTASTATAKDGGGAGRKRSRLASISGPSSSSTPRRKDDAMEGVMEILDEDDGPLPSPIPASRVPVPPTPTTAAEERRAEEELEESLLASRDSSASIFPSCPTTPAGGGGGNRTSTPLTGRSRSIGLGLSGGSKSSYFGLGRSSSVSNPFKRPRVAKPCDSPIASPVGRGEGGGALPSPGPLDNAMLSSPKTPGVSKSLSEKLGISSTSSSMDTSPFSSIFRGGCKPAGLRRSQSTSKK